MNNETILKKAMLKAVGNGWKFRIQGFNQPCSWVEYNMWLCQLGLPVPIIFSHDFAKAIWGEYQTEACGKTKDINCWRHHLQAMVLEKDPIKYLEKFIK